MALFTIESNMVLFQLLLEVFISVVCLETNTQFFQVCSTHMQGCVLTGLLFY